MGTLHVEVPLAFDSGSYALLSEDSSTDIAVVFVHGFGGHPEKTWRNFQELVDSLSGMFPLWQRCDLYFFKYHSVSAQIKDSSRSLRAFLDRVFPCPPRDMFEIRAEDQPSFLRRDDSAPIMLRDGGLRYRALVLCAHSEGALVVRYTVLNIVKEFEDELEQQVTHVAEMPKNGVFTSLRQPLHIVVGPVSLREAFHHRLVGRWSYRYGLLGEAQEKLSSAA